MDIERGKGGKRLAKGEREVRETNKERDRHTYRHTHSKG